MLLTHTELEHCLGKATEIAEQYRLYSIASDDPQRSVDNLMATCKSYLKVNLKLLEIEVDRKDSAIWGACIKTEDGFDICYGKGHNNCWRRFIVCKEVFHVVLDCEAYRNMDLEGHIEEVTVAFPDLNSKPGAPVKVELLAELAAMEFLFPYACRLLELDGPHKDNFFAIADKYKVPQVHVEKYLSKQYMDALGKHSAK